MIVFPKIDELVLDPACGRSMIKKLKIKLYLVLFIEIIQRTVYGILLVKATKNGYNNDGSGTIHQTKSMQM